MEIDGDSVIIDLNMSMDEILEFEEFIRPRVEYIEKIEINESSALGSSALLSLLVSIKQTHPWVCIPFLEKKSTTSCIYGTIHWIYHD